ncbi:putative tricarboxylic transport membrane protein [Blastococcus colisei]|uniref:Putative tricarboxylic transport membrane protein n=1 Tax=Blastococcus colisei TaxID=1564162 RepID=A0A543P1V9_9ACTN|nr:tripartite tricarboxylate transporter permease [Blastococcus colisei]TQN38051.1 putative tricarboxylic transport membrane protein [Blastococcus colisei]
MIETLNALAGGFANALSFQNLLFAFLGVAVGTLVGVLPGLGPSATLAILLPLTFTLPPAASLILFAGIYYGAKYGGSTTAILLNIPGESASVMTTLDGYALAKEGRAGPALGIAAISSFVAGTVGVIGLTFLAPVMAELAIEFGPPEFFGLMAFGLTTIVLLAGDSVLKGILSAVLGLLLATVGSDIVSGTARFTFGQLELLDGIDFVIVAIGVFAVAEVLVNVQRRSQHQLFTVPKKLRELLPSRDDLKRSRFAMAQSSVVGFFIGVLPGAGATVASFVSYGIEKRFSKRPEKLGKGAIEGVAAPEGANNSETGGAMVPLLTLGIPGSSATAIMLAALIIYGLQPGPQLFTEQPDLVWTIIASMYIGNVICVLLNLPLVPVFASILRVPYTYLYPGILVVCVVGVYSLSSSHFDLYLLLLFAVLGYVMRLLDVPPAPLLLAFVLGPLAETALAQSMVISGGSLTILLTRPISLVFLALAALLLLSTVAGRTNTFRTKVLEEAE